MSLMLAIFVGIIVGGLAGVIIQQNYDLLILNLAMGIVGSVTGDIIYFFASGNDLFLFTVAGLLSQIAGALVVVLIFGMLHHATEKTDDGFTHSDD